jgi:hypothetical protein
MKKSYFIVFILIQILFCNCEKKQQEKNENIEVQKITQNTTQPNPDTLSQSDKENAKEAHNTLDIPETAKKDTNIKVDTQKKELKIEPKKEIKEEIKKNEVKKEPTKKITYDKIGTYHKGVATTKSEGKMGLIDAKGQEIVSPKYDFVEDFMEEYARVRIKDKVGFINKEGTEIVPLKFRYVDKFVNGLAKARLIDGETFYINQKGEHICDILDVYNEGIARIKLGKNIGYVDTKGNVIVPAQYSYGTSFYKGVADVKKNDKMFGINAKGVCVRDCK